MIKVGGETVLLYNLNNEKGRKIRFLLVRLGMRIRVIEKEDYGKPLGVLAGMKDVTLENENAPVEDFNDEMMVLYRFSDKRLDALLQGMRKEGIERVDLKAVLTPTNCRWNSWQLFQEIQEEHRTMTGGK
ncbi:DUF3783 domain-containing protein [Frisingicoccus caecimuris]|uniref:Uncharacterized protein DUF3783 n=1 Tax=Frisingicoccus caecimuris TaxID=1796636 RepID=A0A4R2LMI5_9FIRM|nr:DUF3783 domain-containing protein [Frisingicoccus caecimuris]MCR1919047.1 DUF3783 domain-containing protein [Frisingicoccus caecimuris]TCO84825.1 uncharacterized protein DUF3783 [Frisingicoccus caecimuris]